MAVAFDAISSADTRASSVTTHTHSNMTVGSGSNRALVCLLTLDAWATQPTGITVTWDSGGTNQAMTLITGTTAGPIANSLTYLYGLVAPTSGNKNLVVSWTNAAEIFCAAIAFTGVDQTGGTTSFPHGTNTSGSSTTTSITVTSATGNYALAVHQQSINTWGALNQTQIYKDDTGIDASAGNYATGASTVTFTCAIASSGAWIASGCDVAASGGAATKAPPPFHRPVRFR